MPPLSKARSRLSETQYRSFYKSCDLHFYATFSAKWLFTILHWAIGHHHQLQLRRGSQHGAQRLPSDGHAADDQHQLRYLHQDGSWILHYSVCPGKTAHYQIKSEHCMD